MDKVKANPPPELRRLTLRQERFILNYLANNGIGYLAAKEAGYKGNDKQLAITSSKNLRNSNIITAIQAKTAEITKKNEIIIKSRLERKAFWSKMMDAAQADSDKLRASELLGKSEQDFDGNDGPQVVIVQQVTAQAEAELLRARLARLAAMQGAEDGIQRG